MYQDCLAYHTLCGKGLLVRWAVISAINKMAVQASMNAEVMYWRYTFF